MKVISGRKINMRKSTAYRLIDRFNKIDTCITVKIICVCVPLSVYHFSSICLNLKNINKSAVFACVSMCILWSAPNWQLDTPIVPPIHFYFFRYFFLYHFGSILFNVQSCYFSAVFACVCMCILWSAPNWQLDTSIIPPLHFYFFRYFFFLRFRSIFGWGGGVQLKEKNLPCRLSSTDEQSMTLTHCRRHCRPVHTWRPGDGLCPDCVPGWKRSMYYIYIYIYIHKISTLYLYWICTQTIHSAFKLNCTKWRCSSVQ